MLRKALGVLLAITAAVSLSARHENAFHQINSIVASLADISGLAQLHPVPYGRMSKAHLRRFLSKRIRKTLKPEEIAADETALKMFGLVPASFDLKKSTLDLLTEQAAAFYDYEQKKLFLLDMSSLTGELETLAHELGHALADQHFNLEKYMDDTSANDDSNLARTAVVEGQASWLMYAYSLQLAGKSPQPTPDMLTSAFADDAASTAQYPVLKASPLYIQQSLLFPYNEGTLFFSAVYEKYGKRAFPMVFEQPPVDTGQILHPDRYFRHITETLPALPAVASLKNSEAIVQGTVGEFDHAILLWQLLDEKSAKAIAEHLKGGQFRISGQPPVLQYASEWDSASTAQEFFMDYRRVLEKKWKRCEFSGASPTQLAGQGDNGYFITQLTAATVTSVEGLKNAAAATDR